MIGTSATGSPVSSVTDPLTGWVRGVSTKSWSATSSPAAVIVTVRLPGARTTYPSGAVTATVYSPGGRPSTR